MIDDRSPKNYGATLLLAIFAGFLGIHRFYVGKTGTGILYFFTGGLFIIGWVIDVFQVIFANFTDKAGRFIRPGNERVAMSDGKTPEKKKTPIWVWILVGLFGLAALGSVINPDDESSTTSPTETSAEDSASNSGATNDEEAPEVEPAPVEPEVPESFANVEELTSAIEAEFGLRTNMDLARDFEISVAEDGWLNVAYVMDENLTIGLTRTSAWFDTEDIFLLARKADFVKSLTVTAKLPLINNLGEELGPQDVFIAYFDEDVYSRINTDNIAGWKYEDAASSVFIHPALQSD